MGLYRRRHPECSDYYRLLKSGFEEFARNWPEHFEARYGFLRKEVQRAVFSFLECGIPENGVARVRCASCGHDFFVALLMRNKLYHFGHLIEYDRKNCRELVFIPLMITLR